MMNLDDYVVNNELIIHGVDQDVLTWADPDNVPHLFRAAIVDCNIGVLDLKGSVFWPTTSVGIHILGGTGLIYGAEVNYDIFLNNSRGIQIDGAWIAECCAVSNCQLGILLNHFNSGAHWNHVSDIEEDHIRSMSGYVSIENNRCEGHTDYGSKNHRDCIQIVAANYSVGKDGFLSNPIVGVKIVGNDCISEHPTAQGIMFSDGVGVDWLIHDNVINVPSTHGITINRGQSMTITANHSNAAINIGSNKKMLDESSNIFLKNNLAEVVFIDCDESVLTQQSLEPSSESDQDLLDLEPSTR